MAQIDDVRQGSSHFARSLDELRGAAKWLVAAASAVAAVLVTGAQLRNITTLSEQSALAQVAAIAAGVVALLLVLLVIFAAARVLVTPRPTARDLSKRELLAVAGGTAPVPTRDIRDRLVRELRAQRTYLLGREVSLSAFYNEFVAIERASGELTGGHDVTVGSRIYRAAVQQDREDLENLVYEMERRAQRLEDAAQFLLAQWRFRALTTGLLFGGILFVVAIASFVWLTKPKSEATVRDPFPVTISVRSPKEAGLPASCKEKYLSGVAVGGSFNEPTVVTQLKAGCPETLIHDATGVVVIPVVESQAPSAR